MKEWTPNFLCTRGSLVLGAVLALVLFAGPVLADDAPFDFESSNWMSFNRYKEKPSNWLAPDQRAEAEGRPVVVPPPVLPASLPKLKEPDQPIETPPLPGLNKNFDIRVDSTEDDHRLPVIQPDKDSATDSNGLPDQGWKNASDVAHQGNGIKTEDTDKSSSLNVRFTALPPWFTLPQTAAKPAMTPVPVKPALPAVKVAEPVLPPAPAPAPVSKVDAAACAALDAYKKHQLEAIESDRQTLTALQNAIAQLGLQKQLDFLPDVNGSLQTGSAGPVKN